MGDQVEGSASANTKPASLGAKGKWSVEISDCSYEDPNLPAPRLVKIPCKMMLNIMLEELGLPDARYNSDTHEDGEVSSIVTVYIPSQADEKLLQQFKLGGGPAVNLEGAEESAAKEGIRHIERSQGVELEDLNHGELTCLMKKFKILLYQKFKERREREDLAGKKMLKFSQNISSLVCDNYFIGQGNEAESYNEGLEQFEKIAMELSKDAKEIIRKLKKVKQPH